MAEYLREEDMNTGEYISRDVALRQLNATCLATDCDNYNGVRCRACAYADAMDFIEAIPAADVQPVKHGRWIDHKKFERKNCNVCIECSVCNTWFGHDCIPKTKFCPNCGARMDLKDGDEE